MVLSNNGASGEPIAYQRDFYLSVGIIPTYIVTPTVTGTAVVTPIYSELLAIHTLWEVQLKSLLYRLYKHNN